METLKRARKSDNPLRAAINKNFVIRWRYQDEKRFRLIGAGRYHLLVGEELKEKHFDKALNGRQQNYEFKLRERLVMQFASK